MSTTIGRERTAEVTEWMRDRGYKVIIGEFAGGRNQGCYDAVDDYIGAYVCNSDAVCDQYTG